MDTNGLWYAPNNTVPFLSVALSPEAMVSGDIDSNGKDDVIVSINGFGTLAFKNLSALESLDAGVALDIATGNVDGN
jgi:hypothetical protein